MEKQVLVTGSSRGIGKAIAERLAMDGYRIVVHGYHNCAAAAEVAEMIVSRGQSARVLCFDIADRGQCQSVLNADLAQHGP